MRDEEGWRQQNERSVPSRGDRRQGGSKNSASSSVTLDGLTAEREEAKIRRRKRYGPQGFESFDDDAKI
jgi:hypothetical protein